MGSCIFYIQEHPEQVVSGRIVGFRQVHCSRILFSNFEIERRVKTQIGLNLNPFIGFNHGSLNFKTFIQFSSLRYLGIGLKPQPKYHVQTLQYLEFTRNPNIFGYKKMYCRNVYKLRAAQGEFCIISVYISPRNFSTPLCKQRF